MSVMTASPATPRPLPLDGLLVADSTGELADGVPTRAGLNHTEVARPRTRGRRTDRRTSPRPGGPVEEQFPRTTREPVLVMFQRCGRVARLDYAGPDEPADPGGDHVNRLVDVGRDAGERAFAFADLAQHGQRARLRQRGQKRCQATRVCSSVACWAGGFDITGLMRRIG